MAMMLLGDKGHVGWMTLVKGARLCAPTGSETRSFYQYEDWPLSNWFYPMYAKNDGTNLKPASTVIFFPLT